MDELGAVLRTLVNRKLEGYFAGLYVPEAARNDPNLEFLEEAEKLKEKLALLARAPPPEEVRKKLAKEHADAIRAEADEASRAAWERLWH